jgi:hypothetical protein
MVTAVGQLMFISRHASAYALRPIAIACAVGQRQLFRDQGDVATTALLLPLPIVTKTPFP